MFLSMTKNDFRLTFSMTFISKCGSTAETLVHFAYRTFHTDTLKLIFYVILINFFSSTFRIKSMTTMKSTMKLLREYF